MQINGAWSLCDDGIVRPIISGDILSVNGSWFSAEFLVDTGADRTVLSAAIVAALPLQPMIAQESLSGLGGTVGAVIVETQIRFRRMSGEGMVVFRGQYAAVTEMEALDISVLGRDITDLFAVIVDAPGNTVCLLRSQHRYRIEQR